MAEAKGRYTRYLVGGRREMGRNRMKNHLYHEMLIVTVSLFYVIVV
jgi:hypothetical protein